jgi:hypothetical protein
LPNGKGKCREFAHVRDMTPPGFWQAPPQKSGEGRLFADRPPNFFVYLPQCSGTLRMKRPCRSNAGIRITMNTKSFTTILQKKFQPLPAIYSKVWFNTPELCSGEAHYGAGI